MALTAPSPEQVFTSGSAITVTGTATDPDGSVAKVEFLDGDTLLASMTTSPYTFSWTGAAAGTHQVVARATDNLGGMANSPAVSIQVGCTASLMPSGANACSNGGDASFTMTLSSACAWTASSDSSWVILTSASSGVGPATITYSVDPNPSASSRSATITIARQSFGVSQDAAVTFGTPTNVVATGMISPDATTYIHVTWTPVGNASYYEIARSTNGVTFASSRTTFQSSVDLPDVIRLSTYFIEVRAVNAAGTASAYSSAHLVTTALYGDDPIVPAATTIKAQHILDLRTMINSMRKAGGLAAASWTNPGLAAGSIIRATDVTDLRTALNPARTALGYSTLSFTDTLTAGSTSIKAIHLNELRSGTKF